MAATSIPSDRKSARVALVREHVRLENEHHLEGVLSTFGQNAQYQDEAWGTATRGTMESACTMNSSWQHCRTSKSKFCRSMLPTTTSCSRFRFAEPILDRGADFRRRDGEWKSRFAGFIRSTTMIGLPAKGFTMTEPACYDSSVSFVNRKRLWVESDFWSTIP